MNVHRSLWLALPFALMLPLGCAQNTGTGQASEAAVGEPAAAAEPVAATHAHQHGRHHHRGAAAQMFRAARELDLTQDQRSTIEQLAQGLRGEHAGRAQNQAMRAALVEGVRAGAIDMTKVAPLQTANDQARQAYVARQATALDGLWSALQPAQREALVASVRARQSARAAHWAEKKQERAQEGQTASGWQQQRLAHLTTELSLDASQQQAVAGLLASRQTKTPEQRASFHAQAKARNDALLTAFASDSFEANNLDLAPAAGPRMGWAQHRAEFLSQLVPILRADQRETLASSMENEHG